jgi:hypothetical protein
MKTDIPGFALLIFLYLWIRLNKRKMAVEVGEGVAASDRDKE